MANKHWVAYVDGSYNADYPEVVGMGILILDDNGNSIVKYSNTSDKCSLTELNNIGGEIAAAWLAVSMAYQLNCKSLVVYHDYAGVSNWPNNRWNANKDATKLYASEINRFRQSGMDITFKHVDSHSGNIGNEAADYLANYAIQKYVTNRTI